MNSDYTSRIAVIEQKQRHYEERQDQLRSNQEEISRDMKETSGSLRRLAADISVLVANVGHLTSAVEKIHESTNTLRSVEIELANLRAEASSVGKLWEQINIIKTKVDSQNIVIRAGQVLAGAGSVSLVGIAAARLFGGS